MSKGVVLVTGINGFLATYTALAFLEAGYTVRGSARTAEKVHSWIEHFPAHKAAYQGVVVGDLAAPGAFDDAVKGCDIIAHVASPNIPNVTDNERDMLIPAINGTRTLLAATKLEPRIRRVIFTSTLATVVETARMETGRLYTTQDWNQGTYEDAKTSPDARFVYGVSKTLAERAFFAYIQDEKPAWAGTAILPCGVFDPPIQPLTSLEALNRSVAFIWDIARGTHKAGLVLPARHAMYVSARDVAQAHLRAAERDAAINQRYLLIAGTFSLADIAAVIARHFPALSANLPTSNGTTAPDLLFDTGKTTRDLGIEYLSFETIIVDTIKSLLALEEKEKGGGRDVN
ncbi:NAD-P-binding protein [Mycena belliarum]|uniref:NAD-P-binding protein n=1 Tax=Mycena belliarum TaxID=1033014 RepID=A0AAD6U865_9AGAR|nr:NAD-P-binding protein [Mycena belliae]